MTCQLHPGPSPPRRSRMLHRVVRFLKNEDGPTAVEYAVMLAMIIVAAISAVLSTGEVQRALWFDTADALNDVVQP